MSNNNTNNGASAAASSGDAAAASSSAAAAAASPYAIIQAALERGLGALDAAAATHAAGPAAAATTALPANDGDELLRGGEEDDGGDIDDAILEETGGAEEAVVIHAEGEIDEPMESGAPSLVPAGSAPVDAAARAVRPKESPAANLQWHAQAGPRADRGASEEERKNYWRSAGWHQRRMAVNRQCCVSFHWLPFFESMPNLAVARVLNAAGCENVVLLRDMTDPAALLGDFGSQLSGYSPLFWSSLPAVKDAVGLMMTKYRGVIAWSWFDDEAMNPPSWPTMMGNSPWVPSQVICEFRGRLKLWKESMAPGMRDPNYREVDDFLEQVFEQVSSTYSMWAPGLKEPPFPLWFPAGFWGATSKRVTSGSPSPPVIPTAAGGSLLRPGEAGEAAAAAASAESAPVGADPPEAVPGPSNVGAPDEEAAAEKLRRKEKRKEGRRAQAAEKRAAWEEEQRRKAERADQERREALELRRAEDRRRAEENQRRRAEDREWRAREDERKRGEAKALPGAAGVKGRKAEARQVREAEEELRVAGEARRKVEEAFRAAQANLEASKRGRGRGGGASLSRSLPVAASTPGGSGFVRGGGRGGVGAGRGAGVAPASGPSFRGGRGAFRGARGFRGSRGSSFSLPHPVHSTPPPSHASTPRPSHSRVPPSQSPHAPPHPQAASSPAPAPDVRGIVEGLVRALAPALAAGGLLAPAATSSASGLPSGGEEGGAGRMDTSQGPGGASS